MQILMHPRLSESKMLQKSLLLFPREQGTESNLIIFSFSVVDEKLCIVYFDKNKGGNNIFNRIK